MWPSDRSWLDTVCLCPESNLHPDAVLTDKNLLRHLVQCHRKASHCMPFLYDRSCLELPVLRPDPLFFHLGSWSRHPVYFSLGPVLLPESGILKHFLLELWSVRYFPWSPCLMTGKKMYILSSGIHRRLSLVFLLSLPVHLPQEDLRSPVGPALWPMSGHLPYLLLFLFQKIHPLKCFLLLPLPVRQHLPQSLFQDPPFSSLPHSLFPVHRSVQKRSDISHFPLRPVSLRTDLWEDNVFYLLLYFHTDNPSDPHPAHSLIPLPWQDLDRTPEDLHSHLQTEHPVRKRPSVSFHLSSGK